MLNNEIKYKDNKNNYELGGLFTIGFLGLLGVGMILLSWGKRELTLINFKECLYENGLGLIVGAFFILMTLVVWIAYLKNIIIKPFEDIVYLKSDNSFEFQTFKYRTLYFIDRKGKKFSGISTNKEYIVGKYYKVLRKADYIKDILSETDSDFKDVKEKTSYWMNCYLPGMKFEDILILPVIYVIFIIGILSSILSPFKYLVYTLSFLVLPAYLLVYDFIYKYIKKTDYNKKRIPIPNNEETSTENIKALEESGIKILDVIKVVLPSIIATLLLLPLLAQPLTNKRGINLLVLTVFDILITIVIFSLVITAISAILKKKTILQKINKFLKILYVLIFDIAWIGFMAFGAIGGYKQGDPTITIIAVIMGIFGIALSAFIVKTLK